MPDTAALRLRLEEALGRPVVRVVQRRPNPYSTTSPSEIVSVVLPGGLGLQAFLKYESGGSEGSHGHRGDIAYEASVNRLLLRPLGVSVPAFYGFYANGQQGRSFLATEFMEGSLAVKWSSSAAAMTRAAAWIGRFHACGERFLGRQPVPGLRRYDREYFLGWSLRAEQATTEAGVAEDWLRAAFIGFRRSVDTLLVPTATPIHGEYYPHNILVHEGRIRPIDWETAAVAAGEVDLAALTEKWPVETAHACARAYERERWPGGAPPGWKRRLDLARLYLHFRWIADAAWRRAFDAGKRWRLQEVRSLSARLGFG